MANLPDVGVLFYNGLLMSAVAENQTLEVLIRPIPDSSGRTPKYNLYTFRIKTLVAQLNQSLGQTTDTALTTMRNLLTAYAGEFHYDQRGLGAVSVNNPPGGPSVGFGGPARDCVWGPKPRLISFKPEGAPMAAWVEWECDVAILDCPFAIQQLGIMEFVYKTEWDIDQTGYQKRVITGHCSIAQTRATVSSRIPTDQADRLREQINPALLPGFRRIPGHFTLSEDKCRLDFTVTDVEQGPVYPPPGVTEVEMSLSGEIANNPTFTGFWIGTIQATYTMARNVPGGRALGYFLDVCRDRLKRASQVRVGIAGEVKPQLAIPISLHVENPKAYKEPAARFTFHYKYTSSLPDILEASGCWAPVPNSDWTQWSQSLASTAFHCRGNAQLRGQVDAIVDLCQPATPRLPGGAGMPGQVRELKARLPFAPVVPPPETSWLIFWSALWLEQIDETIEMKSLPSERPVVPVTPLPTELERFIDPSKLSPGLGGTRGLDGMGPAPQGIPLQGFGPIAAYLVNNQSPPPPANLGAVVQVRARPTWYVHLCGFGMRCAHLVAPPTLVSVGGAKAVLANIRGNGAWSWIACNWFGLPIHACYWHLRYLLVGTPKGILPVMATPFPDN